MKNTGKKHVSMCSRVRKASDGLGAKAVEQDNEVLERGMGIWSPLFLPKTAHRSSAKSRTTEEQDETRRGWRRQYTRSLSLSKIGQ